MFTNPWRVKEWLITVGLLGFTAGGVTSSSEEQEGAAACGLSPVL